MWRYPGPGFPDRFFSAEMGDVEVNAMVRRALALRVNRRSSPGLVSLREGVISPWVSPLGLAFA
jgi:hypothetical protein